MASFQFFAGDNNNINNLGGSGLGFYGPAGFGASVAVGNFNSNTYITNSAGTAQGPLCDNIKYANTGSGFLNTGTSGIPLRAMPNQNATLNIRFVHDSAVNVQNASILIYDRTNTASGAVGVTTYTANIQHPDPVATNNGSGSTAWTHHPAQPSGAVSLSLPSNPGSGGLWANNSSTRQDTIHDWYLAISASPDSIGSKTQYGLYCACEYL